MDYYSHFSEGENFEATSSPRYDKINGKVFVAECFKNNKNKTEKVTCKGGKTVRVNLAEIL